MYKIKFLTQTQNPNEIVWYIGQLKLSVFKKRKLY